MIYIISYLIFFAAVYFFAYRWGWKHNRNGVMDAVKLIITFIGFIFLSVAITTFRNLSLETDKYEQKFNINRRQIGLKELPVSWKADKELFNNWTDYAFESKLSHTKSYAPEMESLGPKAHYAKSIEIKDSEIESETDWYRNGNKELFITYDYHVESFKAFYSIDSQFEEHPFEASLDTLKHWGLYK